jgi:outer membrane beta-barrel protein
MDTHRAMMRTRRFLTNFGFFAAIAGGFLTELPRAHALQGGEDPSQLPVLIDKRFGNRGVLQLSALFSTAMATKYVEGTGAVIGIGYNFSDLLGLELQGAFFAAQETSIMSEIRQSLPTEPFLSDMYQVQWMGNLDLVFVPLYGKISFASELDPAYDLFLLGGAGFGGLRRQSGSVDAMGNDTRMYSTQSAPIFNVGGGLRFYFSRNPLLGLRLELRDYLYADPSVDSTMKKYGGISQILDFQAGIQVGFGGS